MNRKKKALLLLLCAILSVTMAQPILRASARDEKKPKAETPYRSNEFMAGHVQTLFTDQNGLMVNEINDICQTADGYIWIASYSGLTRYNGKDFEHYSTDSSSMFPATGVICLYPDSKERLWIGSNDEGLIRAEDGAFHKLDSAGLDLSVRSIAEDGNGQIYAATSQGVGYVEGNSFTLLSIDPLLQTSAEEVVVDSSNRLWILFSSGDVAVVKKDGVVDNFTSNKDRYGSMTALYADAKGIVWAGTEGGTILSLTMAEKGILQQEEIEIRDLTQINSFYLDNEERLWICSDDQIGYLNQSFEFVRPNNCRITNSSERIMQDYEGSYWVASSRQGVLKMSDSEFFNLGEAAGLATETVNSTQVAWDDLYIASDKGLFILNQQGEQKETALTKLLEGIRIRQFYMDRKKQLWISTYKTYGVLCVKQDGTYTSYNEKMGLASNTVRSVLERSDGTMAIATGQGIDILKDDRIIAHYGVEQGLSNPVILSMCEDAEGRLYLGTDGNGIYVIDAAVTNEVKYLEASEELNSGVILRMALDPKDRGLWISTGNKIDFYEFKTQKCGSVNNFESFQSNVFDFAFLKDDRMVILYAKGMAVADISNFTGLEGNQEAFPIERQERNAGLSATVTANSWSYLSENEMLYLSLNPGVNVTDLNAAPKTTFPPKVVINRIQIDEKEVKEKTIRVPANTTRITIDFAVPSFVEQDSLTVTYQMEGFDAEPITVGWKDSFSVSYTNLAGGDYVFRVSAKNGDGTFSEKPAFVSIEKTKRFGESTVAIISVIVISAIAVWVIIALYLRQKTKKMQEQKRAYQEITEQSLQTIANTIDAKDSNTNGHSIRVARYSREIARRMELPEKSQEYVYYCALLHDIGKIGIPDAILHKPGSLTKEELQVMRSHAEIGGEILKDFRSIPDIHVIVGSHHEDFNGGGYPKGLENEEIPLFAQIIRVADAYDAMASHRSYRASMTHIYILSEFEKYRGIQFHPEIAKIMEDMIRDGFMTDEDRWK